jgi:hypothetical protein
MVAQERGIAQTAAVPMRRSMTWATPQAKETAADCDFGNALHRN